jgi:hypothetical protein
MRCQPACPASYLFTLPPYAAAIIIPETTRRIFTQQSKIKRSYFFFGARRNHEPTNLVSSDGKPPAEVDTRFSKTESGQSKTSSRVTRGHRGVVGGRSETNLDEGTCRSRRTHRDLGRTDASWIGGGDRLFSSGLSGPGGVGRATSLRSPGCKIATGRRESDGCRGGANIRGARGWVASRATALDPTRLVV